jgi:hypothetical protein
MQQRTDSVDAQEAWATAQEECGLIDCDTAFAVRLIWVILFIAFLTGMSLCLVLGPPLILLRSFGLT